eukprot:606294-Rhodomonas_salina.1
MCGGEAQEFYAKHKIWHETRAPHEHAQNPRVESAIRTLSMRARSLLRVVHANAPLRYWGFAVQAACELENRFLPFMSGSQHTCHEAFYCEKPDNSMIRTWSCRAYVHIEKLRRQDQKWQQTAVQGIYLGTAMHMGYKAHIMASEDGRRMYLTRHNVAFDESVFPWRDKPAHDVSILK